jgi:hypothetical protein
VHRLVVLGCALGLLPAAACAGGSLDAPPDLAGQGGAVLNGEFATRSTIHGTVSLVDANQGFSFCTGTLIAPDVVLTAAHCLVIIEEDGRISGPRAPDDMLIISGVTRISDADQGDVSRVAENITHPSFARGPFDDPARGFGNLDDIGLVVLETPIEQLDPIPVLTPAAIEASMIEGSSLIVEGFGTAEETGQQGSGILRLAEIPLVELGDDEFIAGRVGGADACPGDSGGPVYLERGGELYVVGVVSRSLPGAATRCGGGGIYTLTSAYLDFLGDTAELTVVDDPGEAPDSDDGSLEGDDGRSDDDDESDEADEETESESDPATAADGSGAAQPPAANGTAVGSACSAVPHAQGGSLGLALLLGLAGALLWRAPRQQRRARARARRS